MKNVHTIFVLCLFGILPIQAQTEDKTEQIHHLAFEIENQTPCFLFGGYQLSVGIRNDQLRLRAEVQNTGSLDIEEFAIGTRDDRFRRSMDNGTVGILADYFFYKWFYTTISVESRNWLLHNKETDAEGHLRSLESGLGFGGQYFFYRQFFVQFSAILYFRNGQSKTIQGVDYTIARKDCLAGLRLGVQL